MGKIALGLSLVVLVERLVEGWWLVVMALDEQRINQKVIQK